MQIIGSLIIMIAGAHTFVEKYNAQRALHFFDPTILGRENVWDKITLDEELVKRYFFIIKIMLCKVLNLKG